MRSAQILWDRGEPDGYAQHLIHDPYKGTPNHTVLMIEAFGDHQVANISTETEARTIGALVHQPAIAPGRSTDVTPMWDIPPVPRLEPVRVRCSSSGTSVRPRRRSQSLPPESPQYGSDPHGAARNVPRPFDDEVSLFLQANGAFVDECGTNRAIPRRHPDCQASSPTPWSRKPDTCRDR